MESSAANLLYSLHNRSHPIPNYKSKRKPCCACKMTKKFRDSCIRNNEEEACIDFVKAH